VSSNSSREPAELGGLRLSVVSAILTANDKTLKSSVTSGRFSSAESFVGASGSSSVAEADPETASGSSTDSEIASGKRFLV